MLMHLQTLVLLAEIDRTHQVMQAFRSAKDGAASVHASLALAIAAASLAALAATAILIARHWQRRLASSPYGLFRELCRAHRLNWPQRRLLRQLARSQKLADAGALFLRPECYEIGRLTAEMRPRAEEIRLLRDGLFAIAREEPKSEPADAPRRAGEERSPSAALPLAPVPPTLDLPQWNVGSGIEVVD